MLEFYTKVRGQQVNMIVMQGCEVAFSEQAINNIYELRNWRESEGNKVMHNPTELQLQEAVSLLGSENAS